MEEIIIDKGLGYVFAAVISACATLAAVWYKHHLHDKKESIVGSQRSNESIYLILQKIIEEFGADRAYIYEFHNGEKFFSGQPQKKFSCTYEWAGEGISAESSRSQNYRVTNFHQYIDQLFSDGDFFRPDVDKIKDFGFRALLQSRGVRSLYNIPLQSSKGKHIGFLGVDYVKGLTTLTLDQQRDLHSRGREIAGYLSS